MALRPMRTIGPLHLEDLEPHRFEDLVRQLIYDFRDWQRLEATGRSGSDDGFDARGIEPRIVSAAVDDSEDEEAEPVPLQRLWLIQCKREKVIGGKKLQSYLDEIAPSAREGLHGLIVAAACDFSKRTRDIFDEFAKREGIEEAFLWGRAEIEDKLFLPANDHLLFAYTGISLQSRRRSVKAEVRSLLAAKRKAKRLLVPRNMVLLRDATDHRYPFLDAGQERPRYERGRWRVQEFVGCFWDGLHFKNRRHFAWIGTDGAHWDWADAVNDAAPDPYTDPWCENDHRSAERHRIWKFWSELPEEERAWFEVYAVVPYELIVDIDEHGDDVASFPHVWVSEFDLKRLGPFTKLVAELAPVVPRAKDVAPDIALRVERFPAARLRDVESEHE